MITNITGDGGKVKIKRLSYKDKRKLIKYVQVKTYQHSNKKFKLPAWEIKQKKVARNKRRNLNKKLLSIKG